MIITSDEFKSSIFNIKKEFILNHFQVHTMFEGNNSYFYYK